MRRYRREITLLACAISSLVFFFLKDCSPAANYDGVRVKEVTDGDTVILDNGQRVRYLGLDTPETRKHILDSWVYQPQPFAEEAKEFNKKLVEGKNVKLEFDIERKDNYDRLLAYCFVDGVFVNAMLLEEGLAVLYTRTPNVKYVDLLVAAQKKARVDKKGIWQDNLLIKAEDAKNSVGAIKVVEGTVSQIKESKGMIKFNLNSSRKKGCQVVIFKGDFSFFVNNQVVIARDYRNKRVRVSGLIKEYQGQPEIIVRHPAQIEILD